MKGVRHPGEWVERDFDANSFKLRLARAKEVAKKYLIWSMSEAPGASFYQALWPGMNHAAYYVMIDLTGAGLHRCTCPDGETRVLICGRGGSLCKHVLACLLRPEHLPLLVPYLCLLDVEGTRRGAP